jgi:hypothetical protein
MGDDAKENRLPPPAFPPGQRRRAHPNSGPRTPSATSPSGDRAHSAGDPMSQAFISPDEPLPERKLELTPEFAKPAVQPTEGNEGEVVGMDLDPHTSPIEVVWGGDPHVMELVESVNKLAEALRRRGEAGLRAEPSMSRFEATLRAYCVGYLAGRRAEDPPESPPDEAF